MHCSLLLSPDAFLGTFFLGQASYCGGETGRESPERVGRTRQGCEGGQEGRVHWGLQEPFQVSLKQASRHMSFRQGGCPWRSQVGAVTWVT